MSRLEYGVTAEMSFTLNEDEFNVFKFLFWYMHRTDPSSKLWRDYLPDTIRKHRELWALRHARPWEAPADLRFKQTVEEYQNESGEAKASVITRLEPSVIYSVDVMT